jgi:potassium/chloride transporter 4/5/6
MISRTLGPKFGGSVGIIYVLGFVFLCSLHTFAAGELVHSFIHELWHDMRLIDSNANDPYWDLILLGFIFLLIVFVVANFGIKHIARVELLFLFIAAICYLFIIIGCFATTRKAYNLHGASWNRFKDNWGPQFTHKEHFFTVLAVIFPSVTGILAGINRSGDIKSPQRAIPLGTLLAVILTTFLYVFLIICFAFCGDRLVMRDEKIIFAAIVAYPYQRNSGYYLEKAGILLVILSEALQAMLVGPRIFQTIAADATIPIPKITFFAKVRWGEPRRAMILIFLIAILPFFLGNLERIAVLIAMLLLLCFAFVNLASFLVGMLRSPAWRPRFRLYHWFISLFGFVATAAVMFLISWYWALLAFFCAGLLYLLIAWKGATTNYGDGITGLKLQMALSNLYDLNREPLHSKNWRPQLLVLIKLLPGGNPDKPEILNFVHQLKKGRGLCIVAGILEGYFLEKHNEAKLLQKGLDLKLQEMKLKAFPNVICAPTYDDGIRFLIQYSGLGPLSPNTIVTHWPDAWRENSDDADHFVEILDFSEYTEKAVIVCKGLERFPTHSKDLKKGDHIDVFWIAHDGGLMIMLAYILRQHKVWKKCKLRIFTVVDKGQNTDDFKKRLKKILYNLRIKADSEVIVCDHATMNPYTHDTKQFKNKRRSLMRNFHMSQAESRSNLDELYHAHMEGDEEEEEDRQSPPIRRSVSTSNLQALEEQHHKETPSYPRRSKSMGNLEAMQHIHPATSPSQTSISPMRRSSLEISRDRLSSIDLSTSGTPLTTTVRFAQVNNDPDTDSVRSQLTPERMRSYQFPPRASTAPEQQQDEHIIDIDEEDDGSDSPVIQDQQQEQDDGEFHHHIPTGDELVHTSRVMNQLILQHAQDSQLAIINLPHNIPSISTPEYMEILETLTNNIDKCLLIRGGGGEVITWY